MKEETKLTLSAAQEASQRARWVFLVAQVAGILVFAAVWQSRWSGWTLQRLRTAQAGVAVAECREKSPKESDLQACLQSKKLTSQGKASGEGFLNQWKFNSHEAQRYVDDLEDEVVHHVIVVSVPFIGISIDVNDLSLLGGLGFLLILMWFRFSLWREQQNVDLTFAHARQEGELPAVFELLAMSQVFTVAPLAAPSQDTDPARGFWAGLPRQLFWTPLLVQAVVVLHDAVSLGYGKIVSPGQAQYTLAMGLFLWVLMLWASIQCRGIARRLDVVWREAGREYKQHIQSKAAAPAAAGASL